VLPRVRLGPKPTDIVLSDIAIPGGVDGIDLAFRLRATSPLLLMILTTGFADKLELALEGGFDVIQKPVDPLMPIERLRECLAVAQQGRSTASDQADL
jgi:CheY-like chemotaxis protein